jgi:hypothetical protein
MRQTIGDPLAERRILYVLANDPGALLVAATKETAAIVIVHRGLALGLIIMLVRQSKPL